MATAARHLEEFGGLLAPDAVDRVVLPRRRPGHLRLAAAQRFRQRVADVSGAAARVRVRAGAHARELPAGRRAAGADQRAGGRLLRQGVRHHLSRAAAQRGGRGGARVTRRRCSCRRRCSPLVCLGWVCFRASFSRARTRDGVTARVTRRAGLGPRGAGRWRSAPGRSRRSRPRRSASQSSADCVSLRCSRWSCRATRAIRRVPTWGCGGELTPRTEYTATAFSKPLAHGLPRGLSPDARGRGAGGRVAIFPERGSLPRRDRADVRTPSLWPAPARRHADSPSG